MKVRGRKRALYGFIGVTNKGTRYANWLDWVCLGWKRPMRVRVPDRHEN
jgi:hypothetical protein